MSDDNKTFVQHCAHCGARTERHAYCPKCGALVTATRYGKETIPKNSAKSNSLERICSGCNSIITSIVLKQCPICNARLELVPEHLKPSKNPPGFVFAGKKLTPEIKKDFWNVKEGRHVFARCIFWYLLTFFLLITYLFSDSTSLEITIYIVLLVQIAGIVFGIYPLWYIYSNKHDFKKLGFTSNVNKIILAVIIGILGAILLIGINYLLSPSLMAFFSGFGFDFFDISDYIEQDNNILREADFIWIIVLMGLVCLQAISTEVVFRGVLHNTLKVKYVKNKNDTKGKMIVICLVALIYACFSLLSFIFGIIFFLLNFAVFLVLGILYEINENIWNTIIASAVYHNLLIILILLSF